MKQEFSNNPGQLAINIKMLDAEHTQRSALSTRLMWYELTAAAASITLNTSSLNLPVLMMQDGPSKRVFL